MPALLVLDSALDCFYPKIPPFIVPYPGQFQAPFGKTQASSTMPGEEYSKGHTSCFNVMLGVTLVTRPKGLAGTERQTMVTA